MGQLRSQSNPSNKGWRFIMWATIATLLILPALAMQFTSQVNWSPSDFVSAALLLGLAGASIELIMWAQRSWAYRGAMLVAVALALMTAWANGAVGIIGNENNPLNLLFFIPLLAGAVTAAIVRFRPTPMCWIMAAIAVSQFVIAAIAAAAGHWIWIAAAVVGGGWSLSSILFDRAGREQRLRNAS